jgi:hypothetical protein
VSRGLACLRENDGFWTLPRLASGLAMRARRPRPSEKTASRAIPGPSSAKPSHPGMAPRGGAGSARPRRRHWLYPTMSPLGHRAIVDGCGRNGMPRLASGLAMRARRPRPSEKTASRVISSTSPQGHPSSDSPPLEGRAPHARNIGITPTPNCLLLATGSSATHRGSCYTRACARPYNADAQSASLRENRLSRHLQHFPARPS